MAVPVLLHTGHFSSFKAGAIGIIVVPAIVSVVTHQAIQGAEPQEALLILRDVVNEIDVLPAAGADELEGEGFGLGKKREGQKEQQLAGENSITDEGCHASIV